MTQHKWHKEIKAWADGAEIEQRILYDDYGDVAGNWQSVESPRWYAKDSNIEYRIKPTPKEPQYLYVYGDKMTGNAVIGLEFWSDYQDLDYSYQGKIKLEQDDE